MPPKKAAKPQDERHHEAKDLRRAFEHLGRVETLGRALQLAPTEDVSILASLAQQELKSGHAKYAAELLRTAEHLSFAALAGRSVKFVQIPKDLEQAIMTEFEHLANKADEHWKHGEKHDTAAITIYKSTRRKAHQAIEKRAYYQALEFARAAEALTHAKHHGPQSLDSEKERLKLSAS